MGSMKNYYAYLNEDSCITVETNGTLKVELIYQSIYVSIVLL